MDYMQKCSSIDWYIRNTPLTCRAPILALGMGTGVILLFNLHFELIEILSGHKQWIECLFSLGERGELLMSSAADGGEIIWDIHKHKTISSSYTKHTLGNITKFCICKYMELKEMKCLCKGHSQGQISQEVFEEYPFYSRRENIIGLGYRPQRALNVGDYKLSAPRYTKTTGESAPNRRIRGLFQNSFGELVSLNSGACRIHDIPGLNELRYMSISQGRNIWETPGSALLLTSNCPTEFISIYNYYLQMERSHRGSPVEDMVSDSHMRSNPNNIYMRHSHDILTISCTGVIKLHHLDKNNPNRGDMEETLLGSVGRDKASYFRVLILAPNVFLASGGDWVRVMVLQDITIHTKIVRQMQFATNRVFLPSLLYDITNYY